MIANLFNDLEKLTDRCEALTDTGPLSNMEICVLNLEDKRFFSHCGVDPVALLRATIGLLIKQRVVSGGSTITMQFVRTVTGARERSLRRKAREIFLSILLERKVPKLVILRNYVRHAYVGSEKGSLYQYSENLFGLHHSKLDLAKASHLASFLRYPRPKQENLAWKSSVERRAAWSRRDFGRVRMPRGS